MKASGLLLLCWVSLRQNHAEDVAQTPVDELVARRNNEAVRSSVGNSDVYLDNTMLSKTAVRVTFVTSTTPAPARSAPSGAAVRDVSSIVVLISILVGIAVTFVKFRHTGGNNSSSLGEPLLESPNFYGVWQRQASSTEEECDRYAGCAPSTADVWHRQPSPGANIVWQREVSEGDDIDLAETLRHAGSVLPQQAILKNFVHHNPWELLQGMNFFKAFEYMHEVDSFNSPGQRFLSVVGVDPRLRSNAALAELSAVFLDLGVAKWRAPNRDKGFLYFFASLEDLGWPAWRKHARIAAMRILTLMDEESPPLLAESILLENLKYFGTQPENLMAATRSLLLDLPGWAGMFQRMETHPSEAPAATKVRLADFCAVQSILLRSSMESMARQAGWGPEAKHGYHLNKAPLTRDKEVEAMQNPSGLAYLHQNSEERQALEDEFEQVTLGAVCSRTPSPASSARPSVQFFTSFDERECSFRRHVEAAATHPDEIETFGVAGFFGLAVNYKASDGRGESVLAPEGSGPQHTLVEYPHKEDFERTVRLNLRRSRLARIGLTWENSSFSPLHCLFLAVLFPVSMVRLLFVCFLPSTTRKLTERFYSTCLPTSRVAFRLPYTPCEAAALLARTFKNVGLKDRFASIVVVLGHGSRSVNDPFVAAQNCGACGSREGGPNARLMARCANDKAVRQRLDEDHGICIPANTWFVGGYHDTTSDHVEIYEIESIPPAFVGHFNRVREVIEYARGQNALERCRKFMLANVRTPQQALEHVQTRSSDLGETRPELGHATNAAVVIGRRSLTKGCDLQRRAFLPSYDPFNDDEDCSNLESVMTLALVVCSGINLEYWFSTTHGGAGTKAPMNIVGNLGVQQGTSGDLLVGLPTQLTELHSPVRALFLIDATVKNVRAVLARKENLRQLVHNEWVRLFVRDPHTGQVFKQHEGKFSLVDVAQYASFNLKAEEVQTFVPFTMHEKHGMKIKRRESLFFVAAVLVTLLSCALPVYVFGLDMMHRRGTLIAICGTILALHALAFSRRFLHGEFMFGRFALLSAGMTAGFNFVATAPTLRHTLAGWTIITFCSTFLIGAYNDRPTVSENATFAFVIYLFTDNALLIAAALTTNVTGYFDAAEVYKEIVAACLLVAALCKSGQFPLTSLLVRSMEGPSPTDALGCAAFSAHVGVVLLTGTLPLWFEFNWARIVLAFVGIVTAIMAGFVSHIRADRKGGIGSATAATLGTIYLVLAVGYPDTALVLSLGHATLRMLQLLRSPNLILDHQHLSAALGPGNIEPADVPEWMYRLCWRFNRINTDVSLPHVLHVLKLCETEPFALGICSQWLVTGLLLALAGIPCTPIYHLEVWGLTKLLYTNPCLAACLIILIITVSSFLIWMIFAKVLTYQRFLHKAYPKKNFGPKKGQLYADCLYSLENANKALVSQDVPAVREGFIARRQSREKFGRLVVPTRRHGVEAEGLDRLVSGSSRCPLSPTSPKSARSARSVSSAGKASVISRSTTTVIALNNQNDHEEIHNMDDEQLEQIEVQTQALLTRICKTKRQRLGEKLASRTNTGLSIDGGREHSWCFKEQEHEVDADADSPKPAVSD